LCRAEETILAERAIVESLQAKVLEAIERTEHLVSLAPADRLAWKPEMPASVAPVNDLAHTLGHLLDCLAGFCAVFRAAFPERLADFEKLRDLPVNRAGSVEEVSAGMRVFAGHIARGFDCCADSDLARRIPTLFVPAGETLLTLLLGNLEHLNNHKYQLFLYLKLAGVAVSSRDVYQFRG
jgi:hypothetical protein